MAIRWLEEALKFEGLQEIPGEEDDPQIVEWLRDCGVPKPTDEIPWCAAFVNGILKNVGIRGTGSAASQSFKDWGMECEAEPGAIAIFPAHVAFVVDTEPEVTVIGGNQSDGVTIGAARLYGVVKEYRFPTTAEDMRPQGLLGSSDTPPPDPPQVPQGQQAPPPQVPQGQQAPPPLVPQGQRAQAPPPTPLVPPPQGGQGDPADILAALRTEMAGMEARLKSDLKSDLVNAIVSALTPKGLS